MTGKRGLSEVVRSLSLAGVAEEVNARRVDDLRAKIASASPSARRKMGRLTRLYATGRLEKPGDLPGDLAADGRRMQRVLLALHYAMPPGGRLTRSVAQIAKQSGIPSKTLRRGIYDLEEASLLIVVRRERERRSGGQGMSEYRLVASNLRDLALSQGLQGELFDLDAQGGRGEGFRDSVAGDGGQSGESPEQGHPSRLLNSDSDAAGESSGGIRAGESPGRNGAPTHGGHPPTHGGQAPAHGGQAQRPRGGCSSRELSSSRESSSSSGAACSACAGGEGEDDEEFLHSDGDDPRVAISRRLQRLGLGSHHTLAFGDAAANGWTLQQIAAFLDDVERASIDVDGTVVPKWAPGAVWWQLARGEPGGRITMPPCEAWTRADRDRRAAATRRRQEAQWAEEERVKRERYEAFLNAKEK